MPDKCAFMFLTRENLYNQSIWFEFFNNEVDYNIYIHNKFPIQGPFAKYSIDTRIVTEWGNISLVNATLLLLKEAMKDSNNKYFILLSESCIPLFNFKETCRRINEFNSTVMSSYRTNDCNKRYNTLHNKKFFDEFEFRKQCQWILFKRDDVIFLLKNNLTYVFGKKAEIPDEHYFVNIYHKFNIPFINKNITYVNWKENTIRGRPKIYTTVPEDLKNRLRHDGYLFMRKVIPANTPIKRIRCVIKIKH